MFHDNAVAFHSLRQTVGMIGHAERKHALLFTKARKRNAYACTITCVITELPLCQRALDAQAVPKLFCIQACTQRCSLHIASLVTYGGKGGVRNCI